MMMTMMMMTVMMPMWQNEDKWPRGSASPSLPTTQRVSECQFLMSRLYHFLFLIVCVIFIFCHAWHSENKQTNGPWGPLDTVEDKMVSMSRENI